MKKSLLLAVCCAFITTLSFAQTEQGKFFIGGSADLSFSSLKTQQEYDGEVEDDKVTQTQFSITPSVGYFIAQNLLLSINFQYESEEYGDNKANSLMVGPGIRYYFGSTNVKPFIQGDLMFGSLKSEYNYDFSGYGFGGSDSYESTESAMGYDLGAGVAVFLNKHIAFDFGLGYASATLTSDEDSKLKAKTSGVVFAAGISVHL